MEAVLRRITALADYSELVPIDPGTAPKMIWVAPTDIWVDEEYQRTAGSSRSMRVIARIISCFKWSHYKPPICVWVDDKLHCIDGQHTAVALATLKIESIPVIIVEAENLEERAGAFVGHNRDRVVMDPFDVYKGLLKSGDPDALDIKNVCDRAGVRLKRMQGADKMHPGDCSALAVIKALIRRHGVRKARTVLEALVLAKCTPISRVEIDATEAFMLVKHPDLTVERMASVIIGLGAEGLIRSRVAAAASKRPQKHTLFEYYETVLVKQNDKAIA